MRKISYQYHNFGAYIKMDEREFKIDLNFECNCIVEYSELRIRVNTGKKTVELVGDHKQEDKNKFRGCFIEEIAKITHVRKWGKNSYYAMWREYGCGPDRGQRDYIEFYVDEDGNIDYIEILDDSFGHVMHSFSKKIPLFN